MSSALSSALARQPSASQPYTLSPYRAGDEEAILALFARAFHAERRRDHWAWRYLESPFGGPFVSQVHDASGRLVAQYSAYPVPFYTQLSGPPRVLTCLQVGDTMTAPEVRHVGRGKTSLLARAVRHFYESYCEGRVAFNYGFNTGNIQRFSMLFVRARLFEPVSYRVREVSGVSALKEQAPGLFARLSRRVRGLRVERVEPVRSPHHRPLGAEWDELFERVKGFYRFLVRRDRTYVTWRYLACPDIAYQVLAARRGGRLAGWSVFRRQEDRLVFGDALFDPRFDEAPREVLSHALSLAENQGVTRVEGWFGKNPAFFSETLERLGFEIRPEPQDLGFVFVPFEVDAEADMRAALYYTKGDGDLF